MPIAVSVALLGGLFALFPPIRIVPLGAARARRAEKAFGAREFAESFWENELAGALDRAVDVDKLLARVRADPAAARRELGRAAGLGSVYYFFLRGAGRVVELGEESVAVALGEAGDRAEPDVILVTASVFGNAIRDGTGLLDVSRFASSQDFNAVSAELDSLVERRVLSPLRGEIRVGTRVRFTGCAEVEDEERDLRPLKVVPVALEILDRPSSSEPGGPLR